MLTIERHKVNGELQGCWYYYDDLTIYLAHRKNRQSKAHDGWGFDLRFLKLCQDLKVDAIGVVVRTGKKREFYAALVDDFFGESSFQIYGKNGRERFLPLSRFRVCPDKTEARITRAVKLK